MRWIFSALTFFWGFATLSAAPASAQSAPPTASGGDRAADRTATEPGVHPTLLWFATQAIPSPELAAGEGGVRFGLRWQVTPLLYSWGVNRRLSPWRVLVAEPYVRQSGSVEVFLSPEVVFGGATFGDDWLLRPGLRAYFPVLQHGEYLSVSAATSYQSWGGRQSASFEGGAYVLYGVFGVQLSYAPAPHQPLATIATFRFRYF